MKYTYIPGLKMTKKSFYISEDMFQESRLISLKMGIRYGEYIRYLVGLDIRKYNEKPKEVISEREKLELKRIINQMQNGNFAKFHEIYTILNRIFL